MTALAGQNLLDRCLVSAEPMPSLRPPRPPCPDHHRISPDQVRGQRTRGTAGLAMSAAAVGARSNAPACLLPPRRVQSCPRHRLFNALGAKTCPFAASIPMAPSFNARRHRAAPFPSPKTIFSGAWGAISIAPAAAAWGGLLTRLLNYTLLSSSYGFSARQVLSLARNAGRSPGSKPRQPRATWRAQSPKSTWAVAARPSLRGGDSIERDLLQSSQLRFS
jgi:hypothetical protein